MTIPSAAGLLGNLVPHRFTPAAVEGQLPAWVNGTVFRNGPGLQERFGRRYDHLFEGDGAVAALRLAEGRAWSAHQLVRSEGFVAEEAAGRHLGSLAAPWPVRLYQLHFGTLKNTANTSVLSWQGRLFALMEGARPVELDPVDLSTVGETDLGTIDGTFSAHPHRVASRRTTYNFGLRYGRTTHLDVYGLPDEGAPRKLTSLPLPHPVMLHDFAVSEGHLVFFVAPLRVVPWRMMLALRPFHRNFAWHGEAGSEVIVVPIDAPEDVVRFEVPAFFQWHFGNAFDDGGDVVVDLVRYADAASFPEMADMEEVAFDAAHLESEGRLCRIRIDLDGRRITTEQRLELPCEFPVVDPRRTGQPAATTWVQVERFEEGLLRFGLARVGRGEPVVRWWERGEHGSEPVLLPAPEGERDLLAAVVYDGHTQRSRWEIVDADRLHTVAVVPLQHAVPITFHGCWADGG